MIAVVLFVAVLWAVLTLSGLRDHFSLPYLQQQINDNRVTGLLVVAVPLAVDVAARFNGAVAIAGLMPCIAVFGAVTFGLLLMLCAVVCHVRYGYLGGGL